LGDLDRLKRLRSPDIGTSFTHDSDRSVLLPRLDNSSFGSFWLPVDWVSSSSWLATGCERSTRLFDVSSTCKLFFILN
jgi:hypothetical protein